MLKKNWRLKISKWRIDKMTGYTEQIENGNVTTGKDFLKLCTRAFGVAMDMIEKPLSVPTPTHFEPNPYYKEKYDKAVEVRNKYRQMTFEEAKKDIIKKHNAEITQTKKFLEKYKLEDEKYKKVRDEIKEWIPPTPQYEALKNFALDQIDLSMNTYLYNSLEKELNKELDISDDAVWKYINNMNASCEKNVGEAYEQWQKDLKRTAEKNTWMRQLLESLDNFEYADSDKDIER